MTNTDVQGAIGADVPAPGPAAELGAPAGGWRNPGPKLLIPMALAAIGTNAALLSAQLETLSVKATVIGGSARSASILSTVIAVAGVVLLIAYPIVGRLSDRTTSRLGRRRPYPLIGAVLIVIGGFLTYSANSVASLAIAHSVTALGAVCALTAVTSLVADLYAPDKRGPAAALVALGTPVGVLVGLYLLQLVSSMKLMILLPYGLAVLVNLVLVAVYREKRITRAELPAFSLREFLSTFWVNPIRHRDFTLVWCSRVMLFFGVAAVNAYQFLYLLMVLHVPVTAASHDLFVAALVLVGVSIVCAPLAAKVSDIVGRRKPFVIASALCYAVGMFMVVNAHTFGSFLWAMAVAGLGQGIYFAVDLALATQVLPDPTNPGKDLGILNLGSNLPATLVPVIAPTLLAIGATATDPDNFTPLFVTGAVTSAIGALLIIPVKGVR